MKTLTGRLLDLVRDRTAPLVIDFGFGDGVGNGAGGSMKRYRVTTTAGRIAVDTKPRSR